MLHVVAKNFAKEDKVDEVVKLCEELVELTRKEIGCVKYELHQDVQDATILTMLETWNSQEDLDRHMESEHFKRIVPLLGELMAKETVMNVYKQKL